MASISLFLGAGVSAQFDLPTTAKFKEILIANQNNARHPNNRNTTPTTITSLLNNSYFQDVEEVLQAIKELIEGIKSSKNFSEYGKLAWSELTTPQYPGFKQQYDSITNELLSIENQINNSVFQSYDWNEESNPQLKKFYSSLFSIILQGQKEIDIGTTNYDEAIEEFCRLPNSKYSCPSGFNQNQSLEDIFSPDNFISLNNKDDEKTNIRLFKIHGSLNWRKIENSIVKISTDRLKIPSNDRVFIAPTLNPKKAAKNEPFTTLNTIFNKHLQESQICIIIGYSFRDSHINTNFETFLKNDMNHVIIISPHCPTDFVRNYNNVKGCETPTMIESWLKNHKPKNVSFMEYYLNEQNTDDVLKKLLGKISSIKLKIKSKHVSNT